MPTAANNLIEKINQIPSLPGIYKMLDARGNIIYIGKSKCLKKRVKSYFIGTPKQDKIKKLVSFIADFEIVVTDTHLEARLLECELIKKVKPTFNSQMKQDRGYAYLKVENYNPYRLLSVVNERTTDCYGPFRSSFSLGELTNQLKNLYPIQILDSRYTFEYHLNPIKLDKSTFEENRSLLLDLLTDDSKIADLIHELEIKMQEAASDYRYEAASRYRDIIIGLNMVKRGINGYRNLITKDLLLSLPTASGTKLFYVSKGVIRHKQDYSNLMDQDIESFISEAFKTSLENCLDYDEKSAIDFRDILFSEILSLPEEYVKYVSPCP